MSLDSIHTLTVATYNVHSCVGRDRACDPDRVLAVIAEIDADVIALQEVGHRRIDGPKADQLAYFRDRTGLHAAAGLNLTYGRRVFGNAILSRFPVHALRRVDLSIPGREPRGAIEAELDCGGHKLRVLATHLGLGPGERRRQIERIAHALDDGRDLPTIVMGDFNIFGAERKRLERLGAPVARRHCPASFPARLPLLGLDRIWTRPAALLHDLRAHRTALSSVASDHLPVVGRVTLRHGHAADRTDTPDAMRRRAASR